MKDRKSAYCVLVWRLEGKRPFGIVRRRWEDNIKINLQEMELARHVALMGEGRGAYRVLVW
jgi:hypothetical protein